MKTGIQYNRTRIEKHERVVEKVNGGASLYKVLYGNENQICIKDINTLEAFTVGKMWAWKRMIKIPYSLRAQNDEETLNITNDKSTMLGLTSHFNQSINQSEKD